MRTLLDYLNDCKKRTRIELFFDIETYQYNEKNGKDSPSEFKNMTYSVAVSWIEDGIVEYEVFPNFKDVFDTVTLAYSGKGKCPTVELNAHNTNKYDNHFLQKDLLYFYPHMTVENYYLMTGTTDLSNENTLRIKDLKKEDKQGIILEKRIKSSINLEMVFFLYGVKFETVDNWVKTNSSIAMLGKKLLRLGVVTEDELKTDFDYVKYNKDEDLTDSEAREYAQEIFDSLTDGELTYIRNDVILLAKSVYYYSELFNGFDYSKKTFTSNILESYNTNNLTSFQLLNRINVGSKKWDVRYTDYQFANQNFYDYLKPFYRGGLNFYNQFFVGKIIKDGVFSIDINSSYPYAMHNFKIPTYINTYGEYEEDTIVEIDYSDDYYTLFQISKDTFDNDVLSRIDSIIVRQMLVKYYTTNDFININTYTFKMIERITGIKFTHVKVLSYVTFETVYFGSRGQIDEYYEIKTRGSQKNKIDYVSPYDITTLDEVNDTLYTREEIDNSKVNLNGLYGIPALRPYFNLFRLSKNKDEYVNIENGHKNAERNIVFSIFVTSVSVWNLLSPLGYLTAQEIDDNFLYCDTDSLYMKKAVEKKLPTSLYSPYVLGKWDIEHTHLSHFYVMNHKKYAYVDEDGVINVKSGGIPQSSFDTEMSFEDFIQKQFSHGSEIATLKSIYNKQQTISIYQAPTKLEVGGGYRLRSNSKLFDQLKERLIKEVRQVKDIHTSDVLYIESTVGTFSLSDISPVKHELKNKEPLIFLEIKQEQMKKEIEKE